MNVLEDIFSIRGFHSAPLIPYLFYEEGSYSVGYVTVSFGDGDYEDKSIVDKIDAVAVRKNDKLSVIEFNAPDYPVVLNFGVDKMSLYQEKSEEYCELINSGKYDEAIALFNEIACQDLKNLYKAVFGA